MASLRMDKDLQVYIYQYIYQYIFTTITFLPQELPDIQILLDVPRFRPIFLPKTVF